MKLNQWRIKTGKDNDAMHQNVKLCIFSAAMLLDQTKSK